MDRFTIDSLTTTRLDIALRQPIRMSFGVIDKANILLVRLRDSDGVEGVGEATILGGPFWGSESVEGVRAAVDGYLRPFLVGSEFTGIGALSQQMERLIRGNPAARHAIETAALDLLGRKLACPASMLLGGTIRDIIPVAWTLSTGSTESDIDEGERALAEQGHRRFKLKIRRASTAQDVGRAVRIIDHFRDRATIVADVNQGWEETTAHRYLPMLEEAGLEAIEQPLAGAHLDASARLSQRYGIEVIADEAVSDPASAMRIAAAGAATAIALKPSRDGGPSATCAIAAIATASGLGIYGGTMLETSLGTMASAHIYATVPELRLGSELFGPLRLAEDIAIQTFALVGGALPVSSGPGLGVALDEQKIAALAKLAPN